MSDQVAPNRISAAGGEPASMRGSAFCIALAALAAGWYFIFKLVSNYLGFWVHELFGWQLLFSSIFGVLFIVASVRFATAIWFPREKSFKIICSAAFISCAILSFWFRYDLHIFADDFFFLLNKRLFQHQAESAHGQASILHSVSSYNSHTFFVYSGSASLPNGLVPTTTLNAIWPRYDTFIGCQVHARRLEDSFYVLKSDCR